MTETVIIENDDDIWPISKATFEVDFEESTMETFEPAVVRLVECLDIYSQLAPIESINIDHALEERVKNDALRQFIARGGSVRARF